MKRYILAAALVAASFSAYAQPAPQPQKFVPFTVEEQDARNLRAFLDDQQLKTALPILQWMDILEQRAIAKAAEEKAPKADAPPKK